MITLSLSKTFHTQPGGRGAPRHVPLACALKVSFDSGRSGHIFFELPECPLSSPLTAKKYLFCRGKIFCRREEIFAVGGHDPSAPFLAFLIYLYLIHFNRMAWSRHRRWPTTARRLRFSHYSRRVIILLFILFPVVIIICISRLIVEKNNGARTDISGHTLFDPIKITPQCKRSKRRRVIDMTLINNEVSCI